MLQAATSSAKRAAMPSWWSAAAVLFVSAVLLASTADAQTRTAAIGLHRAWSTQFYVDGNFDSVPDLAVTFGTSSDIGLLADVTGSGMRSPATYNSGFWYLDTNRDGAVDQTILHGGIGDKPLVGDIDGDGKDELVVYRIVPGVGGVYLFLNVATGQTSQVDVRWRGAGRPAARRHGRRRRAGPRPVPQRTLVRVARPHRGREPHLPLRRRERRPRRAARLRLQRRRQGRPRHLPQRRVVRVDRPGVRERRGQSGLQPDRRPVRIRHGR